VSNVQQAVDGVIRAPLLPPPANHDGYHAHGYRGRRQQGQQGQKVFVLFLTAATFIVAVSAVTPQVKVMMCFD